MPAVFCHLPVKQVSCQFIYLVGARQAIVVNFSKVCWHISWIFQWLSLCIYI